MLYVDYLAWLARDGHPEHLHVHVLQLQLPLSCCAQPMQFNGFFLLLSFPYSAPQAHWLLVSVQEVPGEPSPHPLPQPPSGKICWH